MLKLSAGVGWAPDCKGVVTGRDCAQLSMMLESQEQLLPPLIGCAAFLRTVGSNRLFIPDDFKTEPFVATERAANRSL